MVLVNLPILIISNVENFVDEFTDEFTDSMIKIIKLIRKDAKISLNEIGVKIGLSKRGVVKNTNKLKEKGILKRIGTPKSGYWKLTNKKRTDN